MSYEYSMMLCINIEGEKGSTEGHSNWQLAIHLFFEMVNFSPILNAHTLSYTYCWLINNFPHPTRGRRLYWSTSQANLRTLNFTDALYQLAYSQVLLQHLNTNTKHANGQTSEGQNNRVQYIYSCVFFIRDIHEWQCTCNMRIYIICVYNNTNISMQQKLNPNAKAKRWQYFAYLGWERETVRVRIRVRVRVRFRVRY